MARTPVNFLEEFSRQIDDFIYDRNTILGKGRICNKRKQ